MSNVPSSLPPRHALGLPAGSVRALLALSVLGLLWLLALQPMFAQGKTLGEIQLPTVFMDLQILMVLILAHFFSAHGHTIRASAEQKSPLGLPRGSVRFLLLAGYLGLAIYLYRTQPKFEYPSTSALILLLVLVSGFFVRSCAHRRCLVAGGRRFALLVSGRAGVAGPAGHPVHGRPAHYSAVHQPQLVFGTGG